MFQLQKCHPSVMHNEIAFTASLGLRCGVGAAVIKALSGAPGPVVTRLCAGVRVPHVGLQCVCFGGFTDVFSQQSQPGKCSPKCKLSNLAELPVCNGSQCIRIIFFSSRLMWQFSLFFFFFSPPPK